MKTLLLLGLVLAAPLAARDAGQVLMPVDPGARERQILFGYADAVIAGDTIYLSGVVAAPRAGEASLEPAFERAFARIAATLQRAGAGWDDVVDMTTYHTDLAAQIASFGTVKARYVKAPFPAWTAIGISRLFDPAAVVEIKVTAKRAEP